MCELPAAACAALDAAIARAVEEQRIVGTVVRVLRHGQVAYERAAGLADREAHRLMQKDAIFLLASVTKPIVTLAAMRLVEQGAITLQDPVTRWLPGFCPHTPKRGMAQITLHQLLTHSAGLSYEFAQPGGGSYRRLGVSSGLDAAGVSLHENLRRIAAAPLEFEPGTGWGYSMSIDVLGAVIERAADAPLPAAVRRLVTEPLALHDTDFVVRDAARLAVPYGDASPQPLRMSADQVLVHEGDEVRFAPGRLFDPQAFPSGGAGMAGTAADVTALLDVFHGRGSLLRPETVRLMRQAHIGPCEQIQDEGWGFGYGAAVLVDPAATQTPQSAGSLQWGGAYGHKWFVDPALGLTVLGLTNTTFEGMDGRFTVDVRDAVYAGLR